MGASPRRKRRRPDPGPGPAPGGAQDHEAAKLAAHHRLWPESQHALSAHPNLVPQDAVHDGDVLPGAVVVEEGGVATVWGRDPPAVQLRAIRHAEIDIVVGQRRPCSMCLQSLLSACPHRAGGLCALQTSDRHEHAFGVTDS
jgi:hypothetical protein